MLPIQRKISAYNHYKGNDIKYIVIHYVGATGTAKNNADYFYGGDRQASAHYFVDDNSIWQSVEDFNGSWAVGNSRTEVNNKNSINIEMCCPNPQLYVSDVTIQNTCELVVYLMKKYNIPLTNVRTHYEVTAGAKLCPNFANTSRWTNMKNKITQMLNTTTTNKEFKESDYGMILFSEKWYLEHNKDVAKVVKEGKMTALEHYINYGKKEGRSPLPPIPKEFCEGEYLELNPDVAKVVGKGITSGIEHYLTHGWNEKRKVCKEDTDESIKKRLEELEAKIEKVKNILE